VGTDAVKVNKEKVTIDAANFPEGATVSVQVPAGSFKDKAGNNFAGLAAGSWNFVVKGVPVPVDETAPAVAGLSPDNGAEGIAVTRGSLEITFNENVKKLTGNITITGGDFSQTVPVSEVQVSGRKATITLSKTLPYATAISVALPAGTFEDETGNDFTGLAASAWTFTTVDAPAPTDNTAPIVSELSPKDDETDVAENAKLELTFSEEVVAATGNITITVNGTPQTVDVTTNAVKVNKEKVTIDAANFPEGATVSVQVPAGSFKDKAGNNFAGLAAGSWNFTVKPAAGPVDNTPPVVAGLSPASGATGVPANTARLEITFDENINKGTGSITITGAGFSQTIEVGGNDVKVAGRKATIELTQTLPYATAITVQVPAGAFRDRTGNNFTGLATPWTFITVEAPTPTDTTPPTVAGLSPGDDATEVAENAKLEITFSEAVVAATGDITITVNGTTQTVDVTTNAVKINKEKVTIDAASFPEGANVSVAIPAGAFKDNNGNNFAGLAAGDWNFTVKPAPSPVDNTPPVVASLAPAHTATDVPVNANLVITFDENVQKGTGSITLNQGATSQMINLDDAAVEVTGKRVTINPPADFPAGADVSVTIPAGAFRDAQGNPFAGIAAEAWRFTTAPAQTPVDNTPPTVANLSPADDAVDVAPNAKLVLTFSENILKGAGDITVTVGAATRTISAAGGDVAVRGNTATIDPKGNFPEGAAVHVQIPAGAFKDRAGLPFAGIADATGWNFTVKAADKPADTAPPVATAFTPADEAADVAPDAELVIEFNERIRKGKGFITINYGTNSQVIDVTSSAVRLGNNRVTIDPRPTCPPGRPCTCRCRLARLRMNRATPLRASPALPLELRHRRRRGQSRSGRSTPHACHGATQVAEDARLEIEFNETVRRGSGTIILTQGNSQQSFPVTGRPSPSPATAPSSNPRLPSRPALP
jgi:methionine-rich copper-binding protein CopC